MIWYILGTVALVFGGVGLLVVLVFSSNRGASTQPQPAQQQPQGDSGWKKWGKRFGWVFFGFIVWDLFSKFVSPRVPNEWKEWAPSFSWNTFEILVVLVGVYFLWKKLKKTAPTDSGEQCAEPLVLFGGRPQIKWKRGAAESFWIAASIVITVTMFLCGFLYASGGEDILRGFIGVVFSPISLSRGAICLLLAAACYSIAGNYRVIPLWIGVFSAIIGALVYGWGWFSPGFPLVIVPIVTVVLPILLLSIYSLWKSFWAEWDILAVFALVWFVFVIFMQHIA